MSGVKLLDLGLKTAYDELFMDDKGREENRLPRIYEIPLSEIDDFPDHPYQVRMDEDMEQLVESVKERGIITPVTVRPKEDGRFEMVSGHRRKKACELAGLGTVKAEIRELTRDEAILLMVESNLQRSTILPSEKAFAYKMQMDVLKRRPGRPSKENSRPVGADLMGIRSDAILAEDSPDSSRQIQRYIRLTYLVPGLLNFVDESRIALRPAVELSYLSENEQEDLLETISYLDSTPSLAQAQKMRELSKEGKLTVEVIESILSEEKPNQREKISFRADRLRQYLPAGISHRETEDYVLKALEYYQRFRERQKHQQER
ncbi:MAG: ParB/RepB/Spo0J family partition protein [Lachnospiraceae bacterium]|nr:ParB/RepB/Spo0J family partition protein [Lachnospiraceae bacterium]